MRYIWPKAICCMRKFDCVRVLMGFLCVLSFLTPFAQGRTISGIVTDDKGAPLAGATISVKNSTQVAASNANGEFTIEVPSNRSTLVVTYVGMASSEVQLGQGTTVNITMSATAASTLTDVVVIGYGRARRATLSTAQTSVSAKEIERTVNTTIEQAIQGRAAGVYITQNSGQPGGGISVNIRGLSTITGNSEPLYVIDGVQFRPSQISFGSTSSGNALAGLNPNDIEDIQILQGPSATAIYGSQATNGVILITTKRGKSGQANLNYVFQYNIQTPPKHLDVMNLREYAEMVNAFHSYAGGTVQEELMDPSILGEGTDWQGELFNNAPMAKHQLSLSGGNQGTTYYMSGEYMDQQGVAEGSGFKRYGFRLNLDNKPRDWATIGANLAFNQTNEQLTTSQENIISDALTLTPQVPVRNFNGSWGGGDETNGANQFAPVNPIAIANLTTNNNTRRQFLGGLNVGLTFFKGLTFRTSFNANINNGTSLYYVPSYTIGRRSNPIASLSNGNSTNTYWNFNQVLEYNKIIGKHNATIMAGHESQESRWRNLSAGRTGFLTNDVLDLNAGTAASATNGGGNGAWAMESYFSRLSYNYANKYILHATYRRDGSVNFGPNKRWGSFPSVSAAWRIAEEDFFNIPAISELKLRLETGFTGNQGNGGGIFGSLSAGASAFGTGFLVGSYPNPDIQWEGTRTDNLGINIGLLNNRFNIEADYYIKNTEELIMPLALPYYMGSGGQGGISPPPVNAGALRTKGFNFTINSVNITRKDFRWESNLNISHFKTKILRLNSENAFFERQSWWLNYWTQRSTIGMEPWLFRGYIEEGIFQSVEEINNSAVPVDNNGNRLPTAQNNGIWVGDAKYRDINKDGKIDVRDITNIGSPWPKLFGGFTNTFSYKGIDLSILFTATFGNDVYNYLAAVNSNPNNIYLSRNLMSRAMDFARPAVDNSGKAYLLNPETTVPRVSFGPNGNYARNTSRWVEDGSFVRLKNVSLSYNLPSGLVNRTRVLKGVRATIAGQNLLTFTDYSGFDPEVGAYVGRDASSGNQAIGLDFGRYPLTPIYSFTLGVNF